MITKYFTKGISTILYLFIIVTFTACFEKSPTQNEALSVGTITNEDSITNEDRLPFSQEEFVVHDTYLYSWVEPNTKNTLDTVSILGCYIWDAYVGADSIKISYNTYVNKYTNAPKDSRTPIAYPVNITTNEKYYFNQSAQYIHCDTTTVGTDTVYVNYTSKALTQHIPYNTPPIDSIGLRKALDTIWYSDCARIPFPKLEGYNAKIIGLPQGFEFTATTSFQSNDSIFHIATAADSAQIDSLNSKSIFHMNSIKNGCLIEIAPIPLFAMLPPTIEDYTTHVPKPAVSFTFEFIKWAQMPVQDTLDVNWELILTDYYGRSHTLSMYSTLLKQSE
jgi:hypothetical protein